MKTTFPEATGWSLGLPLWIITVEECLNTSIESGTLGCRVTVGGQLRWGRGAGGQVDPQLWVHLSSHRWAHSRKLPHNLVQEGPRNSPIGISYFLKSLFPRKKFVLHWSEVVSEAFLPTDWEKTRSSRLVLDFRFMHQKCNFWKWGKDPRVAWCWVFWSWPKLWKCRSQ